MPDTIQRAQGISLRQILPGARFIRADDLRIGSTSSDWQACRKGDLFAAMVDVDSDGHDFANEAVARGAVGILGERLLPVSVPQCIVSDSRVAFARICHALVGNPSRRINTVAVSGTYGKTTTGILIASILECEGRKVGVLGSLGCCDGNAVTSNNSTAPGPPEIARWLARSEANGCRDAVVEVSNRALARRQLEGLELDSVVLTNVRRDHNNPDQPLTRYRDIQSRVFDHLKPGGFVVANADDPGSKFLISKLHHPLLTIGMHTPADVSAQVLERHRSEQAFLLSAGSESIVVRTQMIGDHHVYNCLSAAAVALALGIDLITIARGLEAIDTLPGRLQRIECGQRFGVYVDVASGPDSLAMALKTLRRVATGRVICVAGASHETPRSTRALLGRVLERNADIAILTSNDPCDEQPLRIAHDMIDGYQRPARSHVLPDRREAIYWALGEARRGDCVLIAGKGNRTTQIDGGGQHHFDDREVVRYWLTDRGPQLLKFPVGNCP